MARPDRLSCMIACGARPNFMKVASLIDAFDATGRIDHVLVHTGQHYDANMSARFFGDLGVPEPDINLGCGSGSHASQTAEIMRRFEPVAIEHRPDWLIVVGDVNSTLACALVAAKLCMKVAHVEAGLRSFDRTMPEEINRVLTDRISNLLFVTEPAGMDNLGREGIDPRKCHLVGDTMADTLLKYLPRVRQRRVLESHAYRAGGYALVTLHRPCNVDDAGTLADILEGLASIASELPVLFPVHPRTSTRLDQFGLRAKAAAIKQLTLLEPLGYLDFLALMAGARLVISDSGGIQEETTILGVTCMTLRDTTERPYTLEFGTNRLVGPTAGGIRSAFMDLKDEQPKAPARGRLTDGKAGQRISRILLASVA